MTWLVQEHLNNVCSDKDVKLSKASVADYLRLSTVDLVLDCKVSIYIYILIFVDTLKGKLNAKTNVFLFESIGIIVDKFCEVCF